MIYEFPPQTDPIRQGDIFVGLPRIDMSLKRIPVINEAGEQIEMTWDDIVKDGQPVATVVALRPVIAIVATQDCDALRAPDITLCEIRAFQDVERKSKETKAPKSWVNIITQHARINQKWFYLPPDQTLGFASKMAVDSMVTLRVLRTDLEAYKSLRKGRLNSLAEAHFRERIGEFFRRYPYDEWYPLTPDEMKAYLQDYPDTKPFPWQLPSETTEG